MKIFIVGKNNVMKWPFKIEKAFSSMGHDTQRFIFNQKNPRYCLMRLLGKKKRIQIVSKKFTQQIKRFNPDLILFVSFGFIPLELYEAAGKFDVLQVAWAADKFMKKEKILAKHLDALFCSDTGYMKRAKDFACPVYYLPLCADTNIFQNKNVKKTLPPVFVGSANPLRIKYFKACQEKCLIYGTGWNKKLLSQHEVHNCKVSAKKAAQMVEQSVLPINLGFSKNNINGLNFRPFEIGAIGSLIVTNNVPDLKLCYKIGKEALSYKTPSDFNKLLKDIVRNPQKYEKIAKAGYERTMKDHIYPARLEKMLSYIMK